MFLRNINCIKMCLWQLVAVLKEVNYLQSRSYENVPDGALELFSRRDELRKYVINLELAVHFYNKIRQTVLEVEYPLIENQLRDIDDKLVLAETSLTWNSQGTTACEHFLQRSNVNSQQLCIAVTTILM